MSGSMYEKVGDSKEKFDAAVFAWNGRTKKQLAKWG